MPRFEKTKYKISCFHVLFPSRLPVLGGMFDTKHTVCHFNLCVAWVFHVSEERKKEKSSQNICYEKKAVVKWNNSYSETASSVVSLYVRYSILNTYISHVAFYHFTSNLKMFFGKDRLIFRTYYVCMIVVWYTYRSKQCGEYTL